MCSAFYRPKFLQKKAEILTGVEDLCITDNITLFNKRLHIIIYLTIMLNKIMQYALENGVFPRIDLSKQKYQQLKRTTFLYISALPNAKHISVREKNVFYLAAHTTTARCYNPLYFAHRSSNKCASALMSVAIIKTARTKCLEKINKATFFKQPERSYRHCWAKKSNIYSLFGKCYSIYILSFFSHQKICLSVLPTITSLLK